MAKLVLFVQLVTSTLNIKVLATLKIDKILLNNATLNTAQHIKVKVGSMKPTEGNFKLTHTRALSKAMKSDEPNSILPTLSSLVKRQRKLQLTPRLHPKRSLKRRDNLKKSLPIKKTQKDLPKGLMVYGITKEMMAVGRCIMVPLLLRNPVGRRAGPSKVVTHRRAKRTRSKESKSTEIRTITYISAIIKGIGT